MTLVMRRFKPTMLMLLIAFVLNAVMPFYAVYTSGNVETSQLSSVFGEKILICTGDSFKWVKLADLQSGKEKPTQHSKITCSLFYAAQGLAAMTLASAVMLPAAAQGVEDHFSYNAPAVFPYLLHRLQARAPPVSFVS